MYGRSRDVPETAALSRQRTQCRMRQHKSSQNRRRTMHHQTAYLSKRATPPATTLFPSLMIEIEIMSMNMARRNAAMHTLLNMDTQYSLILVQEPWFSRIGTARSDGNPDGESILGGVAPPGWEAFHPVLQKGATAKVMIYKRKRATHFNVVAWVSSSPQQTLGHRRRHAYKKATGTASIGSPALD